MSLLRLTAPTSASVQNSLLPPVATVALATTMEVVDALSASPVPTAIGAFLAGVAHSVKFRASTEQLLQQILERAHATRISRVRRVTFSALELIAVRVLVEELVLMGSQEMERVNVVLAGEAALATATSLLVKKVSDSSPHVIPLH